MPRKFWPFILVILLFFSGCLAASSGCSSILLDSPTRECYDNLAGQILRKRRQRMPQISCFFGIIIRMFYNDHLPPHFHAEYGEYEATYEIETLNLL